MAANTFFIRDDAGNLIEMQGAEEQKHAFFIFDNQEVLKGVSILSIDVLEDSKIMDNPVETGIVISDHRIRNPLEITVRCALSEDDWDSTYRELRRYYTQTGTDFLTIKAKADVYANMQLIALPHKETPDSVTRLFFDLRFRSILFVTPSYVDMPLKAVEKPADAKTVDAGQKESIPPPQPQTMVIQGMVFTI